MNAAAGATVEGGVAEVATGDSVRRGAGSVTKYCSELVMPMASLRTKRRNGAAARVGSR